jgi:hypothetical protein
VGVIPDSSLRTIDDEADEALPPIGGPGPRRVM